MILSPGRKFVFIHAPKTGGTSLALALEDRAMKDDIMLGDTPKAVRRRHKAHRMGARGRLWKHATLADIDGLVPSFAGFFVFTLVRNPWDRMVSYYHWLRTQHFDHPAVHTAQALDFGAFVLDDDVRRSMRAHPARAYVTDASGEERCDAYIRVEHFETDAVPLCAHLGFAIALPHVNRSQRHADYRRYYTEATFAAVGVDCAEDISRFGYSFDDAAQSPLN